MADVTFGVKVSEEMKQELSELMKNTQLTGKEFMNLLIHTYRLEKEKQRETVVASDLEELQRLLHRIQHLYMNINERTSLIIEDKLQDKERVIAEKTKELENVEELLATEKVIKEEQNEKYVALEQSIVDKDDQIKRLEEKIKEQQIQIKQQSLLEEKYEEKIDGLNEEIRQFERLALEIDERNEENTKLKARNDELASEVWFIQRELEKTKTENEMFLEKKDMEINGMKEHYALETTNQLLEQRLMFNQKIELLKEEHYKIYQQLNDKIQFLLTKNEENV